MRARALYASRRDYLRTDISASPEIDESSPPPFRQGPCSRPICRQLSSNYDIWIFRATKQPFPRELPRTPYRPCYRYFSASHYYFKDMNFDFRYFWWWSIGIMRRQIFYFISPAPSCLPAYMPSYGIDFTLPFAMRTFRCNIGSLKERNYFTSPLVRHLLMLSCIRREISYFRC